MSRKEEGQGCAAESDGPLRVQAILWNVISAGSVAYALTELIDNLPSADNRTLWYLSRGSEPVRDYQRPVLPNWLFRALCKGRVPMAMQGKLATKIALSQVRPGDVVYLWPPFDRGLIEGVKRRGAIVIAERTNCMGEMVRRVLLQAFGRRKLSLPHGWCEESEIAADRELMLQCDFVTAPNSLVAQSLREVGFAEHRILDTQYGYDPRRLASAIGIARPNRAPVFAFVGLGIVRKGLDVILEAWEEAGVSGKLIIAGQIEESLKRDYANTLARNDVEQLGFVQDIAKVYAAADVFIFPTHEEGGPQVIYEAAACGLASIVSPMGAGRIVREGKECLLVNPVDVQAVATAIISLANDHELRERLGRNAATRAKEFTWAKAGERLSAQFHRARQIHLDRPAR